ncbi:hypothetical protein GGS21DRAFT_535205 [Xylaria nigripes]|nr:hypothetical protein GGS21DRAFT_535205 [Xylaria nigripes]
MSPWPDSETTVQTRWRYDSGPDHKAVLQRLYSSDLEHPGPKPASSPTPSSTYSLLYRTLLGLQPCLRTVVPTTQDHALPPSTAIMAPEMKKSTGASPTKRHQPIGFMCCSCRYHSSGTYCANPNANACRHKTTPRCENCVIIFTPPRLES